MASMQANNVQVAVLKKTMDIERQGAAMLIDTLQQQSANLPAHLGQNINTQA